MTKPINELKYDELGAILAEITETLESLTVFDAAEVRQLEEEACELGAELAMHRQVAKETGCQVEDVDEAIAQFSENAYFGMDRYDIEDAVESFLNYKYADDPIKEDPTDSDLERSDYWGPGEEEAEKAAWAREDEISGRGSLEDRIEADASRLAQEAELERIERVAATFRQYLSEAEAAVASATPDTNPGWVRYYQGRADHFRRQLESLDAEELNPVVTDPAAFTEEEYAEYCAALDAQGLEPSDPAHSFGRIGHTPTKAQAMADRRWYEYCERMDRPF